MCRCVRIREEYSEDPAARRVRRVLECLGPDPVPVMIAIPPEDAVFQVAAYVKGKRAIDMTRVYEKSKQNLGDNTGLGGTLFDRRVETKR